MPNEPMNVLLVEDNSADGRLMRELLAAIGIETSQIESADRLDKAIQRLRAKAIDPMLPASSEPVGARDGRPACRVAHAHNEPTCEVNRLSASRSRRRNIG